VQVVDYDFDYDYGDSSDRNLLPVRRMSLALSLKAFSVSAPTTHNSLAADHCKHVELFSTFRRQLKTGLFDIVYQEHNVGL